MSKIRTIIELSPFIFEDGKPYYFTIKSREWSNTYHSMYCFRIIEKIKPKYNFIFKIGQVKYYEYEQIGNEELVGTNLDKSEISMKLKNLIISNTTKSITDWDGFVGNVPLDVKKRLSRDSKLDNLLG